MWLGCGWPSVSLGSTGCRLEITNHSLSLTSIDYKNYKTQWRKWWWYKGPVDGEEREDESVVSSCSTKLLFIKCSFSESQQDYSNSCTHNTHTQTSAGVHQQETQHVLPGSQSQSLWIQQLELGLLQTQSQQAKEAHRASTEITKLEEQLASSRKESEALRDQVENREAVIAAKDEESSRLKLQLKASQSECDKLKRKVQNYEAAVAVKERENRHIQQRLQQAVQEVDRNWHTTSTETKGRQIEQLQEQLLQQRRMVKDFQQTPLEKDTDLQKLWQQLEMKEAEQLEARVNCDRSDERVEKVRRRIRLRWKTGKSLPTPASKGAVTVDGSSVYIQGIDQKVYQYDSERQEWRVLPDCPQWGCSLAVVNGSLTAIGGWTCGLLDRPTNKLCSIGRQDGGRTWSENFPPMPTARGWTAAVGVERALVVAGGAVGLHAKDNIRAVDVMNTETLQWSVACNLPHPLAEATATVCGNHIYLLGGSDGNSRTKSVLKCTVPALLQSCPAWQQSPQLWLKQKLSPSNRRGVWQQVADVPTYWSTCVTLGNQLLAIGGRDPDDRQTNEIYLYDQTANSWRVVSTMAMARSDCLAAVLPTNELMVVGGHIRAGFPTDTDAVEVASVYISTD